ncbi:hypothetical protein KY284_035876 [Solanum tuberosum]|nr:hypothetical protein KY284_035876 [Solanum tuberosum]
MPHTGGSKSIATLMYEKAENGIEPTRAKKFLLTYKKRVYGRPLDDDSAKAIDMINERMSNNERSTNQPPHNVAWEGVVYSQVLGNENSGYVQGLGLGPTPSVLWGRKSFVDNIVVEDSSNEFVQRFLTIIAVKKEYHNHQGYLLDRNDCGIYGISTRSFGDGDFNSMPERNSISYNALLAGFSKNHEGFKALALFCRMLEGGMELTDFTLTNILNACGSMMERKIREQIHAFILKCGLKLNDHIEMSLVDMCTWCGRMDDAEKIFDDLPLDHDNSIALTSMICAYSRNGQPEEAISLFLVGKSEKITSC